MSNDQESFTVNGSILYVDERSLTEYGVKKITFHGVQGIVLGDLVQKYYLMSKNYDIVILRVNGRMNVLKSKW